MTSQYWTVILRSTGDEESRLGIFPASLRQAQCDRRTAKTRIFLLRPFSFKPGKNPEPDFSLRSEGHHVGPPPRSQVFSFLPSLASTEAILDASLPDLPLRKSILMAQVMRAQSELMVS